MAKAEKTSKSEAPKKKKAVAVHWNSIEEFAAAIDAAGVRPDAVTYKQSGICIPQTKVLTKIT